MAKRLSVPSARWPLVLLGVAVAASMALVSCGSPESPPEADRSAPAVLE